MTNDSLLWEEVPERAPLASQKRLEEGVEKFFVGSEAGESKAGG